MGTAGGSSGRRHRGPEGMATMSLDSEWKGTRRATSLAAPTEVEFLRVHIYVLLRLISHVDIYTEINIFHIYLNSSEIECVLPPIELNSTHS